MAIGCQGPFVRGTNGTCPCWGCKCCPPKYCYKNITLYFDCGSPLTPQYPQGCSTIQAQVIPQIQVSPIAVMPEFAVAEPIRSPSGEWVYSLASGGCSIPCQAITVQIFPTTTDGVCCIEYANGTLYAAGSGDIDATISPSTGKDTCKDFYVTINGSVTPAHVADGDLLTVELYSQDPKCCSCVQTGIKNPTAAFAFQRGGKLFIPRQTLIDNALARQLKLQRRLRNK